MLYQVLPCCVEVSEDLLSSHTTLLESREACQCEGKDMEWQQCCSVQRTQAPKNNVSDSQVAG